MTRTAASPITQESLNSLAYITLRESRKEENNNWK